MSAHRAQPVASASAVRRTDSNPGIDFTTLYCARCGIERQDVPRAVLQRVLYPQARVLAPLLELLDSEFFAADRDFVEGVSRMLSRGEFAIEADEFLHHPANRGMWRHMLRLRASVGRMRTLVNEIFSAAPEAAPASGSSSAPFPLPGVSPRP